MTPDTGASCSRPDGSGRGRPSCYPLNARYRCGQAPVASFRRLAVLVAMALSLLACAGAAAPPYVGKTARPENRFPLASLSEGETTWPAKDLNIYYNAVLAGNVLDTSGFIAFKPNLAKFPLVTYFRVYFHFLDADGRIIDTQLLWAAGTRTEVRFVRWTFQRQWPVPPNAVAMGFSYQGGAAEAGGDSKFGTAKTGWEVQQQP